MQEALIQTFPNPLPLVNGSSLEWALSEGVGVGDHDNLLFQSNFSPFSLSRSTLCPTGATGTRKTSQTAANTIYVVDRSYFRERTLNSKVTW